MSVENGMKGCIGVLCVVFHNVCFLGTLQRCLIQTIYEAPSTCGVPGAKLYAPGILVLAVGTVVSWVLLVSSPLWSQKGEKSC